MTSTDRAVKLLKTTDGRDKLYKAGAGLAKIVAYNAVEPETAKKANAIAKAIGDCRSLMRMAKWVQKQDEVSKEVVSIRAGKSKNVPRSYAKVMRILGDIGYIVGDNLQWLGKYGLLTLDHKLMAKRSKVAQFWGYMVALYLHLYDMLLHMGKAGTLSDSTGKKLIITFVRDLCDTLAALASVGYIEAWKPSSGTVGALGLISATIGSHDNWSKTA
eukprot:TRINITY_DN43537_c0_g1_i1.p1 TRINITY_DN43537_c0_g1~~TRINITY_DN43537_c0_g1_i1.p1  ORF type:complete len:236 (+),score=93.18 TRINITY_DN43537_c0_g1_i1:61-708(+)